MIECSEPHRLVFTWGDDTISFELSAAEGGTRFVLTEELAAPRAARNAAGWEVCLERLVDGVVGEDWGSRFERYSGEFEPVLGAQEGPPAMSTPRPDLRSRGAWRHDARPSAVVLRTSSRAPR